MVKGLATRDWLHETVLEIALATKVKDLAHAVATLFLLITVYPDKHKLYYFTVKFHVLVALMIS